MQNKTPGVSVLVPIYNMQRYLPQCLEALCGQTLRDIEIIAINDGSTDGSLEILQEWASLDTRIKVVDKSNTGYGASMNRGLDKAQGTYVGILEPDDYPEKDMFERLFNAARRGSCDLVKCNFFEHCEGVDTPVENLRGLPRFRSFDPARYPYSICRMPSIWASLYRSEMLKREGIRFRETPGASFQDTSFVLKAWFAARRCALVRKPLLHYRMDNPESSSKTTDKVFVVCDEMADCERFLRERLDRCRGFIPWFYVDKWGKYRWNYNRIDASCHEAFAERMFEEYAAALEACELDLSLFEPPVAKPLKALLDGGARQFAAEYPAGF